MAAGVGGTIFPDLSRPATRIYRAGGARKTFFGLVFVVLLPFFVSLPVMIYQRVAHGIWLETWGLIVIAVAFTIVMLLIFVELLNSVQARIEVGQTGVRFVLPSRRGLLPSLFYRRKEIPYAEIQSVETRRELYGGYIAPITMFGARIVDKAGENHSLGYVSEADVDPLFPLRDIADDIVKRANVPLVHVGTVKRLATRKMLGLHSNFDENKVREDDVELLNRRHRNLMFCIIGVFAVLMGVGVYSDYQDADIDRGEQASDAVVRSAPPVSTAQPNAVR